MPTDEQPAKPQSTDHRDVPPAGGSTTPRRPIWAVGATGPVAPEEPPASAAPPAPSRPSPWPARGRALLGVTTEAGRWIAWVWSQPKVRLVVVGTGVLLLGAVLLPSSAWTLPLIIFGALLLLIASVGSRLDGRFAVDWGKYGTQLEFRAEIRSSIPRPTPGLRLAPVPDDAEVIEGEAHTVEIDVGELKALIAAAEADQSRGTVPRTS
jgi:hypothetical protein